MSDVAIRVDDIHKRYHVGARLERHRTLSSLLHGTLASPWRRFRKVLRGEAAGGAEVTEVFQALNGVTFDVTHGEVVGIIGRNGAGKSTLLKILSRITEPSAGFIEIEGRVGSLLEVGTGFHPELTGGENIFLNGAILGMSRAEIEQKFAEIVAFAEIDKFIETPVKHYSSGMHVRLAFAVAAHLEPEIMLVDEVLAVGDAEFQHKCLGKMGSVAQSGRTILFVSHNMAAINRLCSRALWIDSGRIIADGSPSEIVSKYLASGSTLSGERIWENGFSNPGIAQFALDSIRVTNGAGESTGQLDAHKPFHVELRYRVLDRLPSCRVGVIVRTADGTTVFDAYDSDDMRYATSRQPGTYTSRCTIPGKLLSPARYFISVNAGVPRVANLAFVEAALAVDVVDTGAVGSHMVVARTGIIRPELEWHQEHSGLRGQHGRAAVEHATAATIG